MRTSADASTAPSDDRCQRRGATVASGPLGTRRNTPNKPKAESGGTVVEDTRVDPFARSRSLVEDWLIAEPNMTVKGWLARTKQFTPDAFPADARLRTLQRRVQARSSLVDSSLGGHVRAPGSRSTRENAQERGDRRCRVCTAVHPPR